MSRSFRFVLLGVLVAGAAGGGYVYWNHASRSESTDNAQIDGHLHPVSARVGGPVASVLVKDNQLVEAGAVLVEIDARDYRVSLERARGDLAEARADAHASRTDVPITSASSSSRLSSAEAAVGEARASIRMAETQVGAAQARLVTAKAHVGEANANFERAAKDLGRMKALVAKEEIAQQQYDAAVASADAYRAQVQWATAQIAEAEQGIQVARAALEEQRARLVRAQAEVGSARTGPQQVAAKQAKAESSGAIVMQREADLAQAQLHLDYTVVKAPTRGIVSQKTVEVGQIVQAGQPLLAIVPLDDLWVTANFKESQVPRIRPGQRVTIAVDASGRKYRGRVDSIAAATGSRFSLLPPENAAGNYVKVVQRLPVKIAIDPGQDTGQFLRPGLSVIPTVHLE